MHGLEIGPQLKSSQKEDGIAVSLPAEERPLKFTTPWSLKIFLWNQFICVNCAFTSFYYFFWQACPFFYAFLAGGLCTNLMQSFHIWRTGCARKSANFYSWEEHSVHIDGMPIVLCILFDPFEPRINCLVIRDWLTALFLNPESWSSSHESWLKCQ